MEVPQIVQAQELSQLLLRGDDALRVNADRDAVGPDVPLFLDANNSYANADSATLALPLFERYDLNWIEEPLMPDDIQGRARRAAVIGTPRATGEIHATR